VTFIEGRLGYALARAGRRDEALQEAGRLEQEANRRYAQPASIGLIHAALGDFDRALAWLSPFGYRREKINLSPNYSAASSAGQFSRTTKRSRLIS